MNSVSTSSWDQQAYAVPHRAAPKRNPQPQVVRDDWDDDDDEEEEDNTKVWDEANQKVPMPELIISPSSHTGQRIVPPQPAAFQPTLRILKRPSPSPSASTSTTSLSSSQTRSTLAEREAQYQEARNRIFGDKREEYIPSPAQEGDETLLGNKGHKTLRRAVGVVRDPLGPSDLTSQDKNGPSKGFSERRRGKKQADDTPLITRT
ncbi:hypothetical protein F5I97DRAFT_1930531 [Phlebopus sp. FC_14]|nr:hypothetical protein F5I97DRAFT_1930531 [Phlebopus sp. FC_14]